MCLLQIRESDSFAADATARSSGRLRSKYSDRSGIKSYTIDSNMCQTNLRLDCGLDVNEFVCRKYIIVVIFWLQHKNHERRLNCCIRLYLLFVNGMNAYSTAFRFNV